MLESISAYLAANAGKIPFIAAATTGVQMSKQRVMEAVVIGVVLAGLGYVAIIPRLEERVASEVSHLRADIQRIEAKVDENERARQDDYRELAGKPTRAVRR